MTTQETFDNEMAAISIDGMCAIGREFGFFAQGPTFNRIFNERIADAMRAERNGSLDSVMHHLRRCQAQVDNATRLILAEMEEAEEATP